MDPEQFATQNDLFKKIQQLFDASDEHIVFSGEYSLPDKSPPAMNEEVLVVHAQTDRTIIHSHKERVWRMTGFRWKHALLQFKCGVYVNTFPGLKIIKKY